MEASGANVSPHDGGEGGAQGHPGHSLHLKLGVENNCSSGCCISSPTRGSAQQSHSWVPALGEHLPTMGLCYKGVWCREVTA
jgi:hypothetical protein